MGTENQTPGTDLTSMAAEYGAVPTVGTGPYLDPTDMQVFVGGREEVRVEGRGWVPSGGPRTKRQSELEREFYAQDPNDLATLQKRLHAAGLYGGIDPENIVLGVPDEITFKAYQSAVLRAARYYDAGQHKTVDDVLDEAAGVYEEVQAASGRSGSGRTRAPLSVDLTSPEDLRAIAQRSATSLIGRALSDGELSRFVSSFHAAQGQAQSAAYNTGDAGGTAVAAPSPVAAAETFARQAAPTAAGGQDFLRTFTAFSNILRRRAGSER